MSETRKKKSGLFVWIIMALLVLGLGGFGLTGAFQTSGGSKVAIVGEKEITADDFLFGFQQDINRVSQQIGQNISMQQARTFGVDQTSLRRQITLTALANEADRTNISVGDDAVRTSLVTNPNFQSGGVFSEQAYDQFLNQQNMTRAEFEGLMRTDQAQSLINGAVTGGVAAQTTSARVLMDFIGETRSMTWAELDESALPSETPVPDDAAISAYYAANPEAFTTPETRKITYAMLTPEMLAADIEITDAAIQEVFYDREDTLNTPARRIVDRMIFPDMASASAAYDRIAAGDASFESIALERGLSVADTQLGPVRASQLSIEAADLLFGTTEPGVYGPVEAYLGPAIFRINAVMAGTTVLLADVEDIIRAELSATEAASQMLTKIGGIDDLIAGGASIEDLANETDMQLFTIDYNTDSPEEIAANPVFISEALAAGIDEERDLVQLDNGGILVLRVNEIIPATLRPLRDSREQALAGATAEATRARVQAYANELAAQVSAGADLATTLGGIGITVSQADKATRTSPPQDLPPTIGLEAFAQKDGEVKTYETETGVVIMLVSNVVPFDPESENGRLFLEQAQAQINDDVASDIFTLYANGIVATTDLTINQGLIEDILDRVAQ